MARMVEGNLTAKGYAFGIVASRFNDFFTARLLDGALDALRRHGADEDRITVARVPGSFEIPLVAKRMSASRQYDAVICLGTVMFACATPHFEYIAGEVAKGGRGQGAGGELFRGNPARPAFRRPFATVHGRGIGRPGAG